MKRIVIAVLGIVTILTVVILSGCTNSSTSTITATSTAITTALSTSTTVATTTETSTSTATQTATPKTLKIGIVTPLTGSAANVATNCERAVEMAIADQNAKGGVTIGGQPYTLAAVVRDDKMDPATAKSIANEMVFDLKVPVVFGPAPPEMPALQQILNDNKVLTFGMLASPQTCTPDYPYSFFMSFLDGEYATVTEYVAKSYPDAKRVISFYADLPDEPMAEASAKEMCQYYGLNWLGMVKFPVSTTDFSPYVQKLMSYKPDVIDLSACGGAVGPLEGTITAQIRQSGYTGLIMMPLTPPPGIMNTVPKEYLNKIVTNNTNLDGPVVPAGYNDLINRYFTQYGEEPNDSFVQDYSVAAAFLQFLNTQSTMDTQQWMKNFANYKWTTSGFGKQQFQWIGTPTFGINRVVLSNFWTSEWKDGVLDTDYLNDLPVQLWEGK